MKIYAATSVLYHATRPEAAIGILTDKFFRLGSTALQPAEAYFGENLYFLSTSRTLTSNFFDWDKPVVFEIDGQRMSSNYKVLPVNYWRQLSEPHLLEHEDRVLSTKPTISIKYVVAIHVGVLGLSMQQVQLIKRLGLKNRIPTYFYNTSKVPTTHHSKRIKVPLTAFPLSPNVSSREPYATYTYNKKKTSIIKLVAKSILGQLSAKELSLLEKVSKLSDYLPLVLESEYSSAVHYKMRKYRWNILELEQYIRSKWLEPTVLEARKHLSDGAFFRYWPKVTKIVLSELGHPELAEQVGVR